MPQQNSTEPPTKKQKVDQMPNNKIVTIDEEEEEDYEVYEDFDTPLEDQTPTAYFVDGCT